MATDAQRHEIEQYADHRPEYPSSLWALFATYHHGPLKAVHDIGAGFGNAIEGLLNFLDTTGRCPRHVAVTEPKQFLLDAARARLPPLFPNASFTFRHNKGEDPWDVPLIIEDGGVDLVMSCEAIHWMDLSRTLRNINESLRPDGTFGAVLYAPLPVIADSTAATSALRRLVERHVHELVMMDWMDEGWKRCMRQLYSGLEGLPLVREQWKDIKIIELNCTGGWWCPDSLKPHAAIASHDGRGKFDTKGIGNTNGDNVHLDHSAALSDIGRISVPVDANWRRTVASSEWLKEMLISFRLNFTDDDWASDEWKAVDHAVAGKEVHLEWPVKILLARKRSLT